jgi:hypothetical protein
VTRISELGTTLAATSNRRTLGRNTTVLTRATRRYIPEDTILHSHRRENLKSYKLFLIYKLKSKEYTEYTAAYCSGWHKKLVATQPKSVAIPSIKNLVERIS